ncbi:WD40-repeat-containing domain protein [Myxozyma melibiosi]|uniref:WD40-repeat-containing domain protein n=1 Tax=Myxozyma melibiosi TaxID=54550 RepID=A0ABR1FA70_9ASCO
MSLFTMAFEPPSPPSRAGEVAIDPPDGKALLGESEVNLSSEDEDDKNEDLSKILDRLDLAGRVDFTLRLPEEVLPKIFVYLDDRSLYNCMLVNKAWYTSVNSSVVWRNMFRRNWRWWAITRDIPSDIDWKRVYLSRRQLEQRWRRKKYKHTRLEGHNDVVYCVQFDDDKIITGSRDRTINIWDMKTLQITRTLSRRPPPPGTPESELESFYNISGHEGSVLCLQYDKKLLISGSKDQTIIIWSVEHDYKPLRRLKHHDSSVLDISFDEKYIATCSKDGNICILDRTSSEFPLLRVIDASRGTINSIHLKRGIVASAGIDSVVRIWHVETGKRVMSLHGHERGLACVKISSNKRYAVSGGNDTTIRIWDLKSRAPVAVLEGHTSLIRTLHLHGRRITSGSYDKEVKVWDFDLPEPLFVAKLDHWVLSAKADCKRLLVTSGSSDVDMYDFADGLDDPAYLRYFRDP